MENEIDFSQMLLVHQSGVKGYFCKGGGRPSKIQISTLDGNSLEAPWGEFKWIRTHQHVLYDIGETEKEIAKLQEKIEQLKTKLKELEFEKQATQNGWELSLQYKDHSTKK